MGFFTATALKLKGRQKIVLRDTDALFSRRHGTRPIT
jgi:hypothetical protein